MNGIGKAIQLYMADQKDNATPRLNAYGTVSTTPAQTAGTASTADQIWSGTGGTGGAGLDAATDNLAPMQSVWILVSSGSLGQQAFRCPSDSRSAAARGSSAKKYGWTDVTQYSYGSHWGVGATASTGGTLNPAAFDDKLDGAVVMMADRSPGKAKPRVTASATAQIKPTNHDKDGEAVLCAGGSVRFYKEYSQASDSIGQPRDSYSGYNGDDIYVNGGGAVDMPVTGTTNLQNQSQDGRYDTVIVPYTP